jgi:hypothetical protein
LKVIVCVSVFGLLSMLGLTTPPGLVVMVIVVSTAEECHAILYDQASKTWFMVVTNTGDLTAVIPRRDTDPPPPEFRKAGVGVPVRVEVDGVAQTYSATSRVRPDGDIWAQTRLPRATLRHLQAAVNSRSGFVVTVGEHEPVWFSVPSRAADAFHECGRGILRSRADRMLERMLFR